MKRITVGWICIAVLAVAVVPVRTDDGPLSAIVDSAAAQFPGTIAVYVKQLKTGATAAFHGDDPMDSMSVIKLGIAVKAYQMAEHGQLRLDDRVVLKASDRRGGLRHLAASLGRHQSDGPRPHHRDDHHQRQHRDGSRPGARRRRRGAERVV